MDDLFRGANKYPMIKDDIHAATQHILTTSWPTKNNHIGSSKPSNQLRQTSKGQDDQLQTSQASLIPLNISYNRLLPIIRDMFDFRWSEPIKTDPAKWDQSWKCAYHKYHGHTMEQCRSLHYLMERLIRVKHLKQYIYMAEW